MRTAASDEGPAPLGGALRRAPRLLSLLVVSLLLHLPLTPLGALVGLVALLRTEATDPGPVEALDALPVDLVEQAPALPPAPAATVEPAAAEVVEQEPPRPRSGPARKAPRDRQELDGGPLPDAEAPDGAAEAEASAGDATVPPAAPVEDAASPATDAPASPPDAVGPVASATPDDSAAPAGSAGPPRRPVGDPVALAGAAGKVTDSNANVRLLLHFDRIREHPLGERVGSALVLAYQWREFFGPTGLDPVRDLDRILLAGPQLRDSREVVAVLKPRVSDARVGQALEEMVRADPERNRRLPGPVFAVRVHADRAERLIAIPAPRLVIVAPPRLEKQVLAVGKGARFPEHRGTEVLLAHVVTPWRAFRGIPFSVPPTIRWTRLKVSLAPDGGAVAELEAEDESEQAARDHARQLEGDLRGIIEVKGVLSLFTGGRTRLLDDVRFTSEGSVIRGRAVATPDQLRYLVTLIANVSRELAERQARERERGRAAASASASGPPRPPPAPEGSAAP